MPRKRTIHDEALLDAALDVVHESGPDALTFAALGERVGLAPSTIVQRFGTKPRLLQAALLRAWDRLEGDTAAAIDAAGMGRAGVVDLLVRLTGQYDAHDFAEQLLVLREDLRDPVLRARGQAWFATLTREVERRLTGEPAGLGAIVVAYWQGMLTVWSFTRDEPVSPVVRAGLDDLLGRVTRDRSLGER
jgi:AcrR family transcriptional regulator